MACEGHVFLRERKRLSFGDADLFADEVDAGNHFGDRVFDLKPGVHFDEIELTIFPKKLDGTGAAIAHVSHGLGTDIAHTITFSGRKNRRRRFFEHFLVPAL